MKKAGVAIIGMASILLLAGCGGKAKSANSDVVNLEYMTNSTEKTLEEFKNMAKEFQKENPNIHITVNGQGKDFEALMKAKMASNDLPDLWMTHGWSVERYSEYLKPLNDQKWADNIRETALPSVTDKEGTLYTLPMVIDKSGVLINNDVIKEVGISEDELKTWSDFQDAFEKVKESGKIPVGIGGKDPRNFAQFLDVMAYPVLIGGQTDYTKDLEEGTFDWSNWNQMNDLLLDMKNKGYLNEDCATADSESINQQFANNDIAFMFLSTGAVNSIMEYNPEIDVRVMPIPAMTIDKDPVLVGGERVAVGIWKDTKHEKEALKFLEYLSKDENIKRIAESTGQEAAMKSVTADLGVLTKSFKKYENTKIVPYFDRVNLPSGMWSTLQTVGTGLISDDLNSEAASKLMEKDYKRLIEENKE